jgi:hypothetical protein
MEIIWKNIPQILSLGFKGKKYSGALMKGSGRGKRTASRVFYFLVLLLLTAPAFAQPTLPGDPTVVPLSGAEVAAAVGLVAGFLFLWKRAG